MTWVVWTIDHTGNMTPVSGEVSAEVAESIMRHPSMAGRQTVVMPSWQDAYTAN